MPVSPVLALVGFVGLCLLVGAADGTIIAGTAWGWFLSLNRPPAMAPNWVFVPVWVSLYGAIGVAAWLVWRCAVNTRALRLWGWQLAANAFLAPAFFVLRSPPLALAVSLVLLALIGLTLRAFAVSRPVAAWLMTPYLAWSIYTTYLAAGFWWLNPT